MKTVNPKWELHTFQEYSNATQRERTLASAGMKLTRADRRSIRAAARLPTKTRYSKRNGKISSRRTSGFTPLQRAFLRFDSLGA